MQRELKSEGKPFRAFEVLNLGRYERQAYLNIGSRLSAKKKAEALAKKEQEFRDLILKAYRAEPLPEAGFFHGKTAGRLVVVGPINLPVGRLFVEEVVTESRKRGATRVDVLAFEFEMGLFPAALDEAKQKGIDVTVAKFPWAASGRALSLDRTDGLTKLIIDPDNERILGVGIVGHGAGELIAEGVVAIEMGATAKDLALCVHPHPTLSETLMEAAEVFYGHATHTFVKKQAPKQAEG